MAHLLNNGTSIPIMRQKRQPATQTTGGAKKTFINYLKGYVVCDICDGVW
jgi:Cys-tRNA synthase (O-phospho-L-seryl-tRNA:Cys-tRNA synthase)